MIWSGFPLGCSPLVIHHHKKIILNILIIPPVAYAVWTRVCVASTSSNISLAFCNWFCDPSGSAGVSIDWDNESWLLVFHREEKHFKFVILLNLGLPSSNYYLPIYPFILMFSCRMLFLLSTNPLVVNLLLYVTYISYSSTYTLILCFIC